MLLGLKEGDYWAFAGGVLVGAGVLWVLGQQNQNQNQKSSIAYAYATNLTCSELCSKGLCDAYNCSGKCSAGCDKCGGVAAVGKNCPTCATLCSNKRCTDYNCRCTNGCDACGGVAAVGNCGGTTTTPPPPPPPPGGGPVSGSSGKWFNANGSTVKLSWKRQSNGGCGQGTGGNSGGNRWETVQSGWFDSGFEVVFYFTIKSGKMCKGGHVGLKHGGPEHTAPCDYQTKGPCGGSGCCCWWDSGIDDDQGKAYIEIEGSHPNNCRRQYFANVGTHLDTGKPIGVRWLIRKEGKGIRLMQWIDKSGKANGYNWTPTYNVLDTGQFMPSSYLSHIAKHQNVEIRMSDVDAKDITVHTAETRKITGGSSKYAVAYPARMDEMRPLYEQRISVS